MRNDQVTRQWFLLQKLENPRGATLRELVDSLPEDYSRHPRTIRRDLESLEARFPIYTEKTQGPTRWKLVEGFHRIPPLTFSGTELMALVLSRELLEPLDGTHLKASLDSALIKATAALPAEGADYVNMLREFFSVGLGPHKKYRDHRETVERLTEAIARKKTTQIRYFSASRNKTALREVDPYHLWYVAGALYLVGYCHTRKDVRIFSVDRIRSISLTNKPCQLPLRFDFQAYIADSLMVMRGEPTEVELYFDKSILPWVRDREWHPSQRWIRKNGRPSMVLRVADTPELMGWILSFGAGVRVVRPESLKEKVREEARKIFAA